MPLKYLSLVFAFSILGAVLTGCFATTSSGGGSTPYYQSYRQPEVTRLTPPTSSFLGLTRATSPQDLSVSCDVSRFHSVIDETPNVHDDEVDCFPDNLKCMIIQTADHYGRDVLIHSGNRPPAENRARGGAENSAHTRCAAADIGVEGVSQEELAAFLRGSFEFGEERGQVGEYCSGSGRIHLSANGSRPDYCGSGCYQASSFCRATYTSSGLRRLASAAN